MAKAAGDCSVKIINVLLGDDTATICKDFCPTNFQQP